MLDFYYLNDPLTTSENLGEEEYFESFELDEFMELNELIEFGRGNKIVLTFFEDFKIDLPNIILLLNYCKEFLLQNKIWSETKLRSYKKMTKVLDFAIARKAGIMCLAD